MHLYIHMRVPLVDMSDPFFDMSDPSYNILWSYDKSACTFLECSTIRADIV